MPHSIKAEQSPRPIGIPKTKSSSSRELRKLHLLHNEARNQYIQSNLYLTVTRLLETKNRPAVSRIVSLGLGSLKSTDQTRRIKQLTILLAIAEQLRQYETKIELYAQDPSFSGTDKEFLQSLGVHILSTPSPTELGEAAQYIDDSTLVYCPFLTLEAYQLLFSSAESLNFFIGDDFDALRTKWPKHSMGRDEAESLLRKYVQGFRKRAISSGDGFWDAEDKPFPMAMYSSASHRYQSKQVEVIL
ncbi:hypothetical protein NA57DRAFT_61545 [Rhizodiscina lignyota]|uniref:SRR1-like domain-containing protein n=1 Tax=Rhizodiscina lignyota TaxID=1504668 RepID=A0A9P4M530_9PEZI|nr:hypothetical protein NA57DRAFT_61545 [Rhizodiscina lignyota]